MITEVIQRGSDLSTTFREINIRGKPMFRTFRNNIANLNNNLKYGQMFMKKVLALSLSEVVFIMLTNVKMPTIVG